MAATAVMVITLTIVMTTFMVRMVFNDTLSIIRKKIDVSVYLKDDIKAEDQAALTKAIEQVPIVTKIDYISKDDARQVFVEEFRDDPQQLQALSEFGDASPLPASLRVHVNDPNRLNEVLEVLNEEKNKALQSAPALGSPERRQTVERIANVARFSEIVGLIGSGIFLTISIMIIFNTISMAIFNRRDEIEIMKLIGAEKSFIRGPFIVEASLYGAIAALISVVLAYGALVVIGPSIASYDIEINPTISFFTTWPALIILAQVLIGVMIGIISSLLAMRRHLKV